eukprot:1386337-Amorphochlora_amoeboformis.AAC.1
MRERAENYLSFQSTAAMNASTASVNEFGSELFFIYCFTMLSIASFGFMSVELGWTPGIVANVTRVCHGVLRASRQCDSECHPGSSHLLIVTHMALMAVTLSSLATPRWATVSGLRRVGLRRRTIPAIWGGIWRESVSDGVYHRGYSSEMTGTMQVWANKRV